MTLPPSRLGDLGQRYVVQCKRYPSDETQEWQNCAYTSNKVAAEGMAAAFGTNPTVTEVRVLDRNPELG